MKKINLLTDHEDLADQWHYSRNTAFNIQSVNSSAKVWWKCDKGPDHFWEALVCHRIKGLGCPCCSNLKAVASNCLSTTHPELASQWHINLNEFMPEMVTSGSNKKVWWQCDVAADHYWQCAIVDRVRRNTGCPFCNGKKGSSTNNLALMFPELAEEWDLKNSDSVTNVSFGSAKKFWWRCKNNSDHRWQATINNRTNHNQGCPFCAGKKADANTSIAVICPSLITEWDDERDPNSVLPNCHNKFWWKCSKGHRWKATPNNRVSGLSGCPQCNESKGELYVKKIITEFGVKFSREYSFPDCRHKKLLKFDFAIHCKNFGLVEFHGIQHYQSCSYFGGDKRHEVGLLRDRIKEQYCKNNNIPLLIIPYSEYKNIKHLIGEFIKGLDE